MWWNRSKKSAQESAPPPVASPVLPLDGMDAPEGYRAGVVGESVLFQSLLAPNGPGAGLVVPWQTRADNLGAKRLGRDRGVMLLQTAWAHQGPNQPFNRQELSALGMFWDYFHVAADREVIQQGEYGDYMLVQLTGAMAVERLDAAGKNMRLAETSVGDLIGEMSLLDHGLRFSSCVSLTPCDLAVLTREGLEEMLHNQPQLAARLILVLARKLSIRLRSLSAKLGS